METSVKQQEHPHIACTSCGRKFRYKPELAGRTVKCPCGSAILVPTPHAADESDEYDLAPTPVVKHVTPAAVGLSAPAGAADAPLAAAAVNTRVALPPQRIGLRPEERKTDVEIAPPSAVRDFVVPSALIAIGIALRFFEATSLAATAQPLAFGPAVGVVAMKLALSVGLMLGGMFLVVQMLDVCFVGALPRTACKLVAIAVAPGALYGILSHMGGDTYGSMIGTFASVLAYGLLFWLLMRLDLKDTGWCVLITWILVTFANYAAYKAEGLIRDTWV